MAQTWDAETAIEAACGPLAGLGIVDIGSGDGELAARLAGRGADVTGIDPLGPAQDWTSAGSGRYRLLRAGAERMPFADGALDVALFIFSLHHVPGGLLPTVLRETARVLRPGGTLFVAEPVAEGAFQDVTGLYHDETAVRAEAASILAAHAGLFSTMRRVDYVNPRRYADFETYATRMAASMRFNGFTEAQLRAPAVRARFDAVHAKVGGVFEQPVRVDVLAR